MTGLEPRLFTSVVSMQGKNRGSTPIILLPVSASNSRSQVNASVDGCQVYFFLLYQLTATNKPDTIFPNKLVKSVGNPS